ncbi:TonB-dependent siderophore receptor [Undibacterium oligocarboniphilum]|uniref:TonB-dependent siderophore receptor n=1 Tax=Undibacterium oligocarboniphilum TaxID=666702 RepID=A0A850QI07_9BURK|nr:TonB-dependent siderophore receptor [Undibacterium oligocarboniphilum]MBC3869053.1 TonB-dependent siderophore receptor [Undibacterium oligocarboniphilum]NVO77033.1 TonB-dependent siderophore receptor [Undibacterium oligocarboniphilum]
MTPHSIPAFHRSLLVIAIAQAFAATAYAQSNESNPQEVIVTGLKPQDNQDARSKAAGFTEALLLDTPFSIHGWNSQQLQNLQIRQTTDAMKYDASVNDAYNAVGYAEQFSIRGFALDNNSSYRKDGFAIPGDASIPLENKERIEILKGISGFQSGFATPGGIIDYVTKRPAATPVRSISTSISERGTLYGNVDLSDLSNDRQFGYRINAAGERLRSYVKGADGERQFASIAFDWHLSPQALLQLDADYQHKSQLSVPGFQLFNGTDLPTGVQADMMLNQQPWAKPVDTRDSNLGMRFEYRLNTDWSASVAANQHRFRRDDYTAFPYGCSAANLYPGYCANGDYDVYDYRSLNESKSLLGSQALLTGRIVTGLIRHQLVLGVTTSRREDYFGDYVYDYVGSSNLFHPVAVPSSPNQPGVASLRRTDREQSLLAQDVIHFSEQWQFHAGIRRLHITRNQVDAAGYDRHYWVSNAALVYKPRAEISTYISTAQGLEHGGVAPFGTLNQNQMQNPARSKQIETGIKAELNRDLSVSAALFRITKPLEYVNDANFYVQNGEAQHTGLELSAQGRLTAQWTLGASISALQARQQDTGNPALDGQRVLNVPKQKATLYADYTVAQINGLSLNGSWQYSGNKAYTPDNSIIVPGYQVWNLGARYATKIAGTATTIRFNIDNLADRFYWRDATQALGGYLFPGAPRTYRLSAQFDF